MPSYTYPNDGRIHTRYSELVKCTPNQIRRVVMERFGDLTPFSNAHTSLGDERHQMFQEETSETKRIPKCFWEKCPDYKELEIDVVERHYATEIYKGVVLHSTIDQASTSGGVGIDFKMTTQEAKRFKPSRQLKVYVWQLLVRNIPIHEIAYLVERWNSEKSRIIGYDCFSEQIDPEQVKEEVKEWIRPRVELLLSAIKSYEKGSL